MNVITVVQEINMDEVVDKLFEHMRECGYAAQAPDEEVERLDRIIFESGCCLKCGNGDVKFYPFFKANPRSYRSWVVCVECGWEREV